MSSEPSSSPPPRVKLPCCVLRGTRCALVPYRARHLPRYHRWMQRDELLKLTASERLSLKQESHNRRSWLRDACKYTFIILDLAMDVDACDDDAATAQQTEAIAASSSPPPLKEQISNEEQIVQSQSQSDDESDEDCAITDEAEEVESLEELSYHKFAMAGDVNLFLHEWLDRDTGELEIMIAEELSRRKGIAQEALSLMMAYARSKLHIRSFVAKIGASNASSIALFRDKLHFEQVDYSEAFDEIEFKLTVAS